MPGDYFEIEAAAPAAEAGSRTNELAKKLAEQHAEQQAVAPADEKPASPETETAQAVDDKGRRAELRTKIAEIWKDVPLKTREAIMTREYGAKKSVIDLTTAQMEDFVARLPEILDQP